MAVLCSLSLPIYSDRAIERECYFYDHADWKGLNAFFSTIDWSFVSNIEDVSTMVESFTEFVLKSAQRFIPFGKKTSCENINTLVKR